MWWEVNANLFFIFFSKDIKNYFLIMQILRIWKEPEFKLLMQRACGVNFLLNDYDDDDDDDDQCLSNFIFLL